MKKTLMIFLLLSFALIAQIFAMAALEVNVSRITSGASACYFGGVTIKSIGEVGIELTVEGNLGNTFDLGKIGSVKNWNLLPTLLLSLPSGEIRPYAGVGILTTYDTQSSSFGPIDFETLYYKAGVDVFLKTMSFFAEIQGRLYYHPNWRVSGIDGWRLGVGLTF